MRKSWYHLAARTRGHHSPFWKRHYAVPLWRRLRRSFADQTLAAVLMPDHIHLLVESARPSHIKRQLACELRGFTRQAFPGSELWQEVAEPHEITDRVKLETTIRYIHLNPCRKRYTANPWSWEFSTLFDHSGWTPSSSKSVYPWVSRAMIENALGLGAAQWFERHREFIHMDPYVDADDLEPRMPLEGLNSLQLEAILRRSLQQLDDGPFTRGESKNFSVRVYSLLVAPDEHSCEIASKFRMRRQRIAELRQLPLNEAEIRFLELHAWFVTKSDLYRGPKIHRKSELLSELPMPRDWALSSALV